MSENEVIENLKNKGEGADNTDNGDSGSSKTPPTEPKSRGKGSKSSVEDEILRQKEEEEKKQKEEERLQKLADAKAIIDSTEPDDFYDKELAIEAKVFKDKVKELGREAVAERLERLSIADRARKDLDAAKKVNDFSETTKKQLEKIVKNIDNFNVESAKETLQRSDEILNETAKKNVGSSEALKDVNTDKMSNREFFEHQGKVRQQETHQAVYEFFAKYNGFKEVQEA